MISLLAVLVLVIAVGTVGWILRDTYQTWLAWLKVHTGKKGIKLLGN